MHDPQHAVIAARNDVAVVQQPGVSDALQLSKSLWVCRHQGFTGQVGAGHHQGQLLRFVLPVNARGSACGFVKQQVLNRRAGQHQTQAVQSWCHTEQSVCTAGEHPQQDHRPRGRLQQGPFVVTGFGQVSG